MSKIIHFICNGNTFRSRLAEAYFNSLNIKNYKAESSGIKANENWNGPITWLAMKIIKENNLVSYMSYSWKQTNLDVLKRCNMVVYFENTHKKYCNEVVGYRSHNEIVLNIVDLDIAGLNDDLQKIMLAEQVYQKIRDKIDIDIIKALDLN